MKIKSLIGILCITLMCGCQSGNTTGNTESVIGVEDNNDNSSNKNNTETSSDTSNKEESKEDNGNNNTGKVAKDNKEYPTVPYEEMELPRYEEERTEYESSKRDVVYSAWDVDIQVPGYEKVMAAIDEYNEKYFDKLEAMDEEEYVNSPYVTRVNVTRADRKVISYYDDYPKTFDVQAGEELRLKQVFDENAESLKLVKERLKEKYKGQEEELIDKITFEDCVRWYFDADGLSMAFCIGEDIIYITFYYNEEQCFINENYQLDDDRFFTQSNIKDEDKIVVMGREIVECNDEWFELYPDEFEVPFCSNAKYTSYSNGEGTYVYIQLNWMYGYFIKLTDDSYELLYTFVGSESYDGERWAPGIGNIEAMEKMIAGDYDEWW